MASIPKRMTEKRAESTADSVVASFATFGEMAVARELEDVQVGLKENPSVLFAVSSILADPGLCTLISDPAALKTLSTLAKDGTLMDLLKNSTKGGPAQAPSAPLVKRPKLRVTCKKMKHLSTYKDQNVVLPALMRLNRNLFEGDEPIEGLDLLAVLAWALKCNLNQQLPHMYLEKGSYVDDLLDIFVARHIQVGKPLEQIATRDQLKTKGGWYYKGDDNNKQIKTVLSQAAVVTFDFAASVRIEDPFDLDTAVTVVVSGKPLSMSLRPQFEESGLELPALEGQQWELAGFAKREDLQEEAQVSGAASVVSGGSPPAKKPRTDGERANFLSASLRKRLAGASGASSQAASSSSTPSKKGPGNP